MIKNKFVVGILSLNVILFSAGLTYFGLSALLLKQLPSITAPFDTHSTCEPTLVSGELIVAFNDTISERLQNQIIMAYKGTVAERTFNSSLKQYTLTIKVEAGQEQATLEPLKQTPGVVSAAQNRTSCPA